MSVPLAAECCTEATICDGCRRPICFEHDEDPPIRCEGIGETLCRDCHSGCMSLPCARENDPTDYYDIFNDR